MTKRTNNETRRAADFGEYQHDGRTNEPCAAHSPIKSTTNSEQQRLVRTLETYRDALAWMDENPIAWASMTRYALDRAMSGHRFGGQELIEIVRARDFADRYGRPTRTNNSFAPIFVRLLVKEHPHLREFVEMRHSIFDRVVGA